MPPLGLAHASRVAPILVFNIWEYEIASDITYGNFIRTEKGDEGAAAVNDLGRVVNIKEDGAETSILYINELE